MKRAVRGKSLVDQIIDTWFAELEDAQEFDASTIGRLRRLASSGTLRKPTQVTKAIKVALEVQDETH
jgi:hypothetical protein